MTRSKAIVSALVLGALFPAQALAADPAAEYGEERAGHDDGPPLLLGRKLEIGGYGGLDVAYSRMFGRDGALVGAQGALLLDHRLSLGVAGYGWTNSQSAPPDAAGNPQRFETGYGGATIRYSLYAAELPVYISIGTLVGGGAVSVVEDDDSEDFDFDDSTHDEDVFAVIQPDVTLHANLTRWLRLGITAGYRFTRGVDRHGYDESDIDGFLVGGQVQFGRF